MFLRSLLQRKHKKDHEGVVSKSTSGGRKQKGSKEVNSANEVEPVNNGHQACDTPDYKAVEKSNLLDSSDGEPPVLDSIQPNAVNGDILDPDHRGNLVDIPAPLPSSPLPQQEEPDEFTTPTSGLCEEMSLAEEPRSKVLVGQQGDGTYKDEELIKLSDVADNIADDSNSEDEGFSGSDSQIEEFIKEVIATVSLELQRESSLAVNEVEPSVEDGGGKQSGKEGRSAAANTNNMDNEHLIMGDIGASRQSVPSNPTVLVNVDKDECACVPVAAPGISTIPSTGAEEKLEASHTREECRGSIADRSKAFSTPTTAYGGRRSTRNSPKTTTDKNTESSGATSALSSQRDAVLERQVNILSADDVREISSVPKAGQRAGDSEQGTPISSMSIVGESTEHGDSEGKRSSSPYIPKRSETQREEFQPLSLSANGGGTDARSKGRSSNVLACRFYMDDESKELPNVTSSPFQPDRNGVGAFYNDYSDRRYARMGRGPDITPIRNEDGNYDYPPHESRGDYSIENSESTGDLSSVGAYSNRGWSRIEDVTDSLPYELDDFETSDRYEVFVPRSSLEEFVITPCDDSDSDDGEEYLPEPTPQDGTKGASNVSEGTNYPTSKLNPIAKEWTGGDPYAFHTTNDIDFDDASVITSSPTEGEMTSQQSTEGKRQELKNWEQFREENLDRALRTLLSKLDSRIDRLPEHFRDQIVELRAKIAKVIDLETPNEPSPSTEDDGEISLMDKRVSAVMEQQASLALSLKNTEESTRIMETQLEQFEAGEEERKKQVVSLREEVEDATARQRSLTVMLNEERRLNEALQLRLATMTQEKQQLLYNNVMLWEQTSQLELKQEHFQGVSDQEKQDLEDQMKALEAELIELRSRKAGEPVTKISVESACSAPSDHNLSGASTPNGDRVDGEGEQGGYKTPRHGRYGHPPPSPPPGYEEEGYYPPYPPYQGHYRHNANNSGFPFPPRGRGFPPPFFRRGYPRRRGDNLTVYFDRMSKGTPMTWYPSNSREEFQSSPRGGGRRPFPRRGRGRGYGRGRRGRFQREDTQK